MAGEPAPAAPPSPAPSPSPAPAPAARPGSLTGTRYDAPISDQAFDRLGPQEQSRFARVRDAANNPRWQPRSDLAPDPAKPAAASGEPAPPAAPASGVDGKLVVGEYSLSSDDIASLMRTRAELDLRATQVPATATDYKPDLPADLKLPPGIEFKINTNDPVRISPISLTPADGIRKHSAPRSAYLPAGNCARPRRSMRHNARKSRS